MKTYLCDWGNCDEELSQKSRFQILVTVKTVSDTFKQRYCCYEHAALAMAKSDKALNGSR